MNDDLRGQYENYPYPPRSPADEAKRLIVGSPSQILEIDHHIFAGGRDPARPFRALVAGGGTGDATVMLAQRHADAGIEAEIVRLDISEASLAVAKARIGARGLSNARFVHGAIEDLPSLGLGTFDYVDCCGVLHHLADPVAGLRALAGSLGPDGGMGIMVYAPLGRTGVYHVQAMLRMIAGDAADPERIDVAKRLLGGCRRQTGCAVTRTCGITSTRAMRESTTFCCIGATGRIRSRTWRRCCATAACGRSISSIRRATNPASI